MDWVDLLDRAIARRNNLLVVIENLNARIQKRLQALDEIDEEIAEYRKKIVFAHRREAA